MIRILHSFILFILVVGCNEQPKPPEEKHSTMEEYHPTFTSDYLMGQFNPKEHQDFVVIEKKYADVEGRIMRKEAYDAFIKMWDAARMDGIQLTIISATRNFDYQKGIWERKWTGKTLLNGRINATTIIDSNSRARAILEYSSMPGTSRHHWGTDIDINALNNSYFTSGKGKKEFEWLQNNASTFGFCRSYTEKSPSTRVSGYEEEKWHWSYAPLSTIMLKDAQLQIKDSMITGFLGAQTAPSIEVVKNYILGVDITCQPDN